MKHLKFIYLVILSFFVSSSFAQGNSPNAREATEFLRSVDPQERSHLARRHPLKLAEYEYFAKPGRIGIYHFDVDVLRKKGEAITFRPFNGPPIEVMSHGLTVNHDRGGHIARWSGEIELPNGRGKMPLRMFLRIWAVGDDGELKMPDPNREATRQALEQGNSTVLAESYQRRNERIVYELVSSTIRVPARNTTMFFDGLVKEKATERDLNSIVVYEIDDEKVIHPADDTLVEGPDETDPKEAERLRRIAAFDAHMDQVKRDIAKNQNEE